MGCKDCNNTGWVSEGNAKKECACVIRERAINYLTPVYASAVYAAKFASEKVDNKDIFVSSSNVMKFKSVFKSFLLNTAMKYTHMTVSAYDILQAYLTNTDTQGFYKMTDVDILVVFLIQDPSNKSYGNIISSLLQARQLKGKRTWIFSSRPFDSGPFQTLYGTEISDFIRNNSFLNLAVGN